MESNKANICLPSRQPYGIFHVRSPVGGRVNFPYGRYD
jgi:hypothetical protein